MLTVELADPYVRVIYPVKTISVDIAVKQLVSRWGVVFTKKNEKLELYS